MIVTSFSVSITHKQVCLAMREIMTKKLSTLALREKGIYLLPNLFTLSALFFGFYAIVSGIQGSYQDAAIAIIFGLIMDSLDGRVARLTQTQTAFGADLDSLSDMVNFGVAPALVMYLWQLQHFGKVGWLISFAYVAVVALRLARFNNTTDKGCGNYFQGLPCPAPAGLLGGMLWSVEQWGCVWFDTQLGGWALMCIMVCLGGLMVSNVPYYNGKQVGDGGKVPFRIILFMVAFLLALSFAPALVIFGFFTIYVLYGLVMAAVRRLKKV